MSMSAKPVEAAINIAASRDRSVQKDWEQVSELGLDDPSVLLKLNYEMTVTSAIWSSANKLVNEMTEPLKSIVNK